jgi:hypothetical protein
MATKTNDYIAQPGDYLFPPKDGGDPAHDIAANVLAERGDIPTTWQGRARELADLRSSIARLNHMAPGDEAAHPLRRGQILHIPPLSGK